jgi:hypothetical protein
MKNLFARTLTSLLLGVSLPAYTAQAQRIERVIDVNIPFEFNVGTQTFAAGHYSLVNLSPSQLQLRDAEGRSLTTVLTNSVQTSNAPAAPKLQFHNQDGRYVLGQVWQANDSIGQQLPPPQSLTQVAKTQVAKRRSKHVQTASVSKPQ